MRGVSTRGCAWVCDAIGFQQALITRTYIGIHLLAAAVGHGDRSIAYWVLQGLVSDPSVFALAQQLSKQLNRQTGRVLSEAQTIRAQ